jgi:hypothetical protein
MIELEFICWISEVSIASKSKKRKRREETMHMSQYVRDPKHLRVILLAISAHGMSDVDITFPIVLKHAFENLHDQCIRVGSDKKLLLAEAGKTSLLLAFVERCILMGSAACNDVFSQQLGIDIFNFLSLVVMTLTSIPMSDHDAKAFEKNALLRSAAMRLSVTASDIFGGSNAIKVPVEEVSRLVANSTLTQPFPSSTGTLGNLSRATLQFDGLSVLGSIGRVIPDNCSDDVLQVRCKLTSGVTCNHMIFPAD